MRRLGTLPATAAGHAAGLPELETVADPPTSPAETDPRVQDLELVREILDGSAEAWERFIRRYTGLILAVIRRYLHVRDRDDLRNVYVDILSSLRERKLAGYEGRAALSNWLTVVTRSEVLDELRHRFGRREIPEGLRALAETDRLIYTLYYVGGLGLRAVRDQLCHRDPSWTLERLLVRLRAIEDVLDDRVMRRIAYDLHAQSTGAASGRLLAYLDHVHTECSQNAEAHGADYHLMEQEARQTIAQVRECIASMDARDRQVLELRFERGWSAQQIADELGLRPRRRVYTLIERILRGLRRRVPGREGS